MIHEDVKKLTREQLEAIAAKAIEHCKWVGWIKGGSLGRVQEFKRDVEKIIGGEIEEYT